MLFPEAQIDMVDDWRLLVKSIWSPMLLGLWQSDVSVRGHFRTLVAEALPMYLHPLEGTPPLIAHCCIVDM